MSGRKRDKLTLAGGQLLSRGDVVKVVDEGLTVSCRVLSCLGGADGTCRANLEILEGPRAGLRISAVLRAGEMELNEGGTQLSASE